MNAIEKLNAIISDKYVVYISSTSFFYTEFLGESDDEIFNEIENESKQYFSSKDQLSTNLLFFLKDYITEVLNHECDDECIKETLYIDKTCFWLPIHLLAETYNMTYDCQKKSNPDEQTNFLQDNSITININGIDISPQLIHDIICEAE